MRRGTLELSITATCGKAHAGFLRHQLSAAHAMLKSPLRQLSVALVGKTTMSRLHRRYLGIGGPTDVLSFPLETDGRGRPTFGEIVVCVPVAAAIARSMRRPARLEVLLYAVHGLLHLSGFDDRTDCGYRKMHRKEDAILRELGFGPVFAGD